LTEPTAAEIIRRWEQSPFRRLTVADEDALIASHKALAEAAKEARDLLGGKAPSWYISKSNTDRAFFIIDVALKAAGVK